MSRSGRPQSTSDTNFEQRVNKIINQKPGFSLRDLRKNTGQVKKLNLYKKHNILKEPCDNKIQLLDPKTYTS